MINEIELLDVVSRVVEDLFPGTTWEWFVDDPSEEQADTFVVEIGGDTEPVEPGKRMRMRLAIKGPLGSKRAQDFVRRLPPSITLKHKLGRIQGLYGKIARDEGPFWVRHLLELDDQVVAEEVFRGKARELPEPLYDQCRVLPAIIETLRAVQSLRYESKAPEISVLLPPPGGEPDGTALGNFTSDFFASNRSLITLCARGAAALQLSPDAQRVVDVVPLERNMTEDTAVPRRLAALAHTSQQTESVCISLDASPAIQILSEGSCIFRLINHRYVWMDNELAASTFASPAIGRKLLSLAADLADGGHGAILACCDKDRHKDILSTLVHEDCLPYAWDPAWELYSSGGRFNAWLLKKTRTIQDLPPDFLLNLCSFDGATFFGGDGELLGYGAILKTGDAPPEQGARTTAAKYLSERVGPVIKVSEDRNAVLFVGGKPWGRVW